MSAYLTYSYTTGLTKKEQTQINRREDKKISKRV